MQAKLHQWAAGDPGRCFEDLFNLVADPAFLTVAWERVRSNRGARTAGVDRLIPRFVTEEETVPFLDGLRAQLKTRTFRPLPVRERMIPKAGSSGKLRALGIPTAADRCVQAALKLVLEPIFEADFEPVSYGFRPNRRAQDAIAEIHFYGSRGYHGIFEGDITACFDEISHPALMDRVRARIADKHVLALLKSFLKAGILSQDGTVRDSAAGTPQGGILSPVLANIALSVLDEHFRAKWDAHGTDWRRIAHRRAGGATYRIVRYADDFVIMVHGTAAHTEALREEVAAVLAPMGLRLSPTKTRTCHIDEGFDFLGFHIQRRTKKGTNQKYVYTYPSKKALASITGKVRALTNRARSATLEDLLRQVNPVIRGWCMYFRHGVSKATFRYLDDFVWSRVTRWLRKRHRGVSWKDLRRRYLAGSPGQRPAAAGIELFLAQQVEVTRYRWRGNRTPTPWAGIRVESPV
jgi:RNA-directed DNA polymerase